MNKAKRGRPRTGRTTTIIRVPTAMADNLRLVAAARHRTIGEIVQRYIGTRLDREAAALAGGK